MSNRKLVFYQKFVDDIYSRHKLGDNVLFHQLSNYDPNSKFTIELNPNKFLDMKRTNISGTYKFNLYQ